MEETKSEPVSNAEELRASGDAEATAPDLAVLSRLYGLGHSDERIAELSPAVTGFLREMAAVWVSDPGEHEMAIEFDVRARD